MVKKSILGIKPTSRNKATSADSLVEEDDEDDASGTFDAYFEYNRILRTWFVVFGVGGPVLFLTNEKISTQLIRVNQFRLVVVLFLVGVGLQVFGAFVNKVANWYVFQATVAENVEGTRRHKFSEWLLDNFWIDISLDFGTISAFGYAAWLLLNVFAESK
jgi:hypothetical protein